MKGKSSLDARTCLEFGLEAGRVESGIVHALGILSKGAPTPVGIAVSALESATASAKKAGGKVSSTKRLAAEIAAKAEAVVKDLRKGRFSGKAKKAQRHTLVSLLDKAKRLREQGGRRCGS